MANKVLLEVEVTGKGIKVVQKNLDKLSASTNKASASTNKLTKSRNQYDKGAKGVAGATSNGTKAFSKMRSEIGGGSSGLVAAYATLAANLFAASAAFNALRSASKVDQLVEGLDRVGIESGRNLSILADNLKRVTDNAISTEEALRATALATSAGFSNTQLESLGIVAKGASIALGRDLGDALDRLVRGTAKLEPEILDELGIFVRLDDAVSNYASSVGKSAEEVTDFERRQAFLNEAISKGIDKFSGIAEAAEANPYDKLGATFQNLAKEILTSINSVAVPVLNVFANNMAAVGGVVALFASTISKQMLPALADGASQLAKNALAAKDNAVETSKNLVKQKESLKVYNQLIDKIDDGTASQEDFRSGLNSLDGSLATSNKRLEKEAAATTKGSAAYKLLKADVDKVKAAKVELLRVQKLQAVADAKENVALGIGQLQRGQLVIGFKTLTRSVIEYNTALNVTNVTKSRSIGIFNGLRTAVFGVATGLRVLATGFFALLGPIGLLLSIGPLVYDFLKDRFFPSDNEVKVDEFIKGLNRINETVEHYSQRLREGSVESGRFANAAAGVLTTASEQVQAAFIADAGAASNLKKKLEENDNAIANFDGAKSWSGKNADGTKNFVGVFGELIDKQKEMQEELKTYETLGPRATAAVQQAVKNLKGEVADGVTFIPPKSLELISAAESALLAGMISFREFQDILTSARAPFENYVTGLKALDDQASDVRDTLTGLGKRTATPFDELLEKTQALAAGYEKTSEALDATGASEEAAFKRSEALLELQKKLQASGLYIDSKDSLDAFNTSLETSLKRQRELPKEIKDSEAALKKVKIARAQDANALEKQFEAEVNLNNKRKELITERLNTLKMLAEKSELSTKESAERQKLQGELNNLTADGLKLQLKEEEVAVKKVQDAKKLLDLRMRAFRAEMKILDTERERRKVGLEIQRLRSGGTDGPSARAELATFRTEKAERLDQAKKERDARLNIVAAEFMLANVNLLLLEERARLSGMELKNADAIQAANLSAYQAGSRAAEADFNLAKDKITLEEELLKKKVRAERDGLTESLGGIGAGFATTTSMTSGIGDAISSGRDNISRIENDPETTDEEKKAGIARERLAMTAAAAGPFIEQLKALGPEGVLVAAVTEGSMVMADAFIRIGEAGDNMGDKLSAIGNIIGAIGTIAAAAGQQRVAAIDKEIAAEKKRDGKSKESMTKIAALEKKKESIEKKNFERNKKIQMAQIVINTAAAYMKTLGETGFFGIPLGAIILGLGAAQLAVVAGTSYQGGSSVSDSGAAPSPTISVGKQTTKTDLATSSGAAGELGYFRGESGSGGPENFKPAFMGAKYRKEGGPTAGYVVGEQGPELFVPETPGKIMPNDQMKQSAPVNANISISALDASGVEEILVAQRGNIIGMLREAVNSYGEDFYEDIDTAVYTPSSAGAGKY